MTKYQVLYDLRSMLHVLERDLGLNDLTRSERDVLLAAQSLTMERGEVVYSRDIRKHNLVKEFPPATYHRSLRALQDRGLVKKADGSKAKSYVVATV
jgi:hypothetical protein